MKNSKSLFVKWFIIFAAIIAACLIAGKLGVFSLILVSDISHISSLIAVLFLGASLTAGKLSYDLSRDVPKVGSVQLKQKLNTLNFLASSFFTLGLLGTIVGFCFMMHGTLNANVDVAQIIAQLKVGASTKLYTTLAGIVSSLLLQLQILVIENDLIKD